MVVRTLIAVALIALSGAYARSLAHRGAAHGHPPIEQLPREVAGWSSTDRVVDAETARVLGADRTLHRRYRNRRGEEVGVFVAYFARQQVNAQVHSPRHCLPGGGWRTVELESDTLHPMSGHPQPIMRMLVQRQEYRHEILYWFQTRTGSLTSEYALKFNLMMNALRKRPTDVAFVRYDAPHSSAAALRELAAEIDQPLKNALREAGLH
jgi:EpsI family protein